MKTATYTPGPWFIKPSQTKADESLPRISSEYGEICQITVRRFELDLTSDPVPHYERYANSKLIAAAPELLEACKLLRDAEGAMFGTEYSNQLLQKAADVARAAISKAEGNA